MKDVVVWMIKIEIQRQNNRITYFEIKGHADFSGFGEDVICAAVSSVGQMTINGLIETLKLQEKLEYVEKDGLITCDLKESELTDGYVKFEKFGNGKKRVSIYPERAEA